MVVIVIVIVSFSYLHDHLWTGAGICDEAQQCSRELGWQLGACGPGISEAVHA
jgi:hypothetical protein